MQKDLLMIAKEHELRAFQKNKEILSRLSSLEEPLNDVYDIYRPNATDYNDRRDLIRVFNEIAMEIHGSQDGFPVVKEFGSFLMDMFDAKSDLDLSINFSDKKADSQCQRDVQISTLRKFAKKLRALENVGHVRNVTPILSARVPVLKVTDFGSGIECDLSVGNLDAIVKSHIIRIISAIDERFQKLCYLMKVWARSNDINSSRDGTLNSLSLILLVAFHLQTRQSPIFPPFSAILKDGTDPMAVQKVIPSFMNYGRNNKESLAELFVSLLILLQSVEILWDKGLCASVFDGSWKFKTWITKKGSEKFGCISIEDFTDRSQNTARAVRPKKKKKIHTCIRRSLQNIGSFVYGELDAIKLKVRLFGPDSVVLVGNQVIKEIAEHSSHDPKKRKNNKSGHLSKTKRKRARILAQMASSSPRDLREQLDANRSQGTIAEITRIPHHREHYLPRTHHEQYRPRTHHEYYPPRSHHEHYPPRTHHGHYAPRTHHEHYPPRTHHEHYSPRTHHEHYSPGTHHLPYHPFPQHPPHLYPPHPTQLSYPHLSSYPHQQYPAGFEHRRDSVNLQSAVYRRNV